MKLGASFCGGRVLDSRHPVVDALRVSGPVRKPTMSKLIRPISRANAGLNDARSTGAGPSGRVRDILALKGTKK
jgi:hypothetical protein